MSKSCLSAALIHGQWQFVGDFGGGLKIMSLLDDFDAERSHRGIFLDAVAERYDNRRRDTVLTSGKSHGLAVILPRRGDHSVGFDTSAAEIFEIRDRHAL